MGITELKNKRFEVLSDGQKQRTLIARAVCQDPDYLIMDEPTSFLDIRYQMELMEVLRELSSEGLTIIMSLHEPALALEISSRLILVESDGKTSVCSPKEALEKGRIKELYQLTDRMYEKVEKSLKG